MYTNFRELGDATASQRLNLRPKASKETTAGKRLPYARHLDDSVTLETRDGLLMQVESTWLACRSETADSEEAELPQGRALM
ncbi:hypothetical protein ACRAWD_04410 [Caulobacter segnis]